MNSAFAWTSIRSVSKLTGVFLNRTRASSTEPFIGPRSPFDPKPVIAKACRAVGIEALYLAWRDRGIRPGTSHEGRKVAVYRDRKTAAIAALIHLPPVAGSIAIIALNLRGYYIGGELAGPSGQDVEKLAGLQFAAKIHELLINASLAALLFSYIQYQIALGGGLPYGAVFAGLQFKDLSFLWSSEYWGAARARFSNPRQKWFLLLSIAGVTLLGLTVGPSSANILKPRLDWWQAGGTNFWMNGTREDLFPLHYTGSLVPSTCAIDTGDASCPSGDWGTLAHHYLSYWTHLRSDGLLDALPEIVSLSGVRSLRSMIVKGRSPNELYKEVFTWASVPFSALGDAVAEIGKFWTIAAFYVGYGWRFKYRLDARYSVDATQPVVHVRCVQSNWLMNSTTIANPEFSPSFYNLADTQAFAKQGEFPAVPYKNDSLMPNFMAALNGSYPTISWIDLPGDQFGNASIGIAVTIPPQSDNPAVLNLCTVDASLGPSNIQSTRDQMRVVTGDFVITPEGSTDSSWPKILIDLSWANYLFPVDPNSDHTIFIDLLVAAGLWKSASPSQFGVENVGYILEVLFATSIVNGLTRVKYNTTLAGNLRIQNGIWQDQMMPVGKHVGYGGDAFELGGQSPDSVTQFTAKVTAQGYAYNIDGWTTSLSIMVHLIYCMLALGHTGYLLKTGYSSASWDSISELTTLAMNSRRTGQLKNTGAGIDTLTVFEENVQVMTNGEHLEFVFGEPGPDMEKVEENVPYS